MTLLIVKLLGIAGRWAAKTLVALSLLFLIFVLVASVYPFVRAAWKETNTRDAERLRLNQEIERLDSETIDKNDAIAVEESVLRKLGDSFRKIDEWRHNRLQEVEGKIQTLENQGRPWKFPYIWRPARVVYDGKMLSLLTEQQSLKFFEELPPDAPEDIKMKKKEWLEQNEKKATAEERLTTASQRLKTIGEQHRGLARDLGLLNGSRSWFEELRVSWLAFKGWIAPTITVILIGPLVWALLVYYGFAGAISRKAPITFSAANSTSVCWSTPASSHLVRIGPDETLFVRSDLLTQYDHGLSKRTAALWSWKAPAVSIVSGLSCCTKCFNDTNASATATISSSDPEQEISEVVLEEDSELVLQPNCLVAIQGPIRVRVAWRLFSLDAWLTAQLRYIIFQGPGSVYLIASRGIEGCQIKRTGGHESFQGFEQSVIVGFDAKLGYAARRTETFFPYLLGKACLFDDYFCGEGVVLRRNAADSGKRTLAEKMLAPFWSVIGKILGF